MNIAIIPARQGSKRIKNKNIKKFCGKPIIAYSIELAIKSKIFDKIIVSTDCHDIAELSKSYGASVPFLRPSYLADDFTGIHDVLKDTVLKLKLKDSDLVCCIFATAPLIKLEDVIRGFEKIKSEGWEIVLSATKFNYSIFRSFFNNHKNGLEMVFPKSYNVRSQDLKEVYHDAGQFFWSIASVLKKPRREYNPNNGIIEIPSWRSQDIDTVEDWQRAEMIFNLFNNINFER